MFHWICPECGQEIAPGVKECPVCEPQASASPLPSGAPSPAAPAPSAASAAPEITSAVAVLEQPVPEPQIVLQPEVVLPPEVVGKLEPQIIPELQPDTPLPEPETFADRLADLAERLHGEHIQYAPSRIVESVAAPRPRVEQAAERPPLILDVIPARPLLAPPPTLLLLAEPQPPAIAAELPAQEVFHPRPSHPARSQPPRGAEPSVPSAPGEVRLPDRPGRVAAPALGPFQDYFKAADRQMRPAMYSTKVAGSAAASATEPRVTLPGPALPRELMSLQAAGLVPIGRRRGNYAANRYGWMTKILVLAMLLTAGVAATLRMMPGTSASVPAKPPAEPAAEQSVVARPDRSHSLARFVEVTGVRFMEVNKKPQIRYLVVNHSSDPLGSVTVYVTLRATNSKPGQPPLSRFTFRSPTLAAFEAKEMASPIERVIGPLDLPDWQDLQADVEVQ